MALLHSTPPLFYQVAATSVMTAFLLYTATLAVKTGRFRVSKKRTLWRSDIGYIHRCKSPILFWMLVILVYLVAFLLLACLLKMTAYPLFHAP